MSENTASEPGQEQVDELIEDLELHALPVGSDDTNNCTHTCPC
ncbi:hypothetical protein [Nonomuraea sp. NPDC050310]